MKKTLILCCGISMSAALYGQTIIPDPTFSKDGKVIQSQAAGFDAIRSVAIQGDGKIVASVELYDDGNIGLVRYHKDGSSDLGFGVAGLVTTDLGLIEQPTQIALQPDGKIVVGGLISTGKNPDMLILRYNKDGSLDASFGSGGSVIIDRGQEESVRSLALAPDGKIVVSGEINNIYETKMLVVRLNTNGSLDKSFDVDGIVTYDNAWGLALAVQPDKKIVVSGQDFYTVRFKENGTVDSSFGTDGATTNPFSGGGTCHDVLIQPDGAIVLAGSTHNGPVNQDFGVVRLKSDGSPDVGFGSAGTVRTNFGYGPDMTVNEATAILYQPDGKLVVTGSMFANAGAVAAAWFTAVRYQIDGSDDLSFNSTGQVVEQLGNGLDYCNAAALQPDGRIVMGGQSLTRGENDMALLRLAGDSTLAAKELVATGFRAAVWPNIVDQTATLQLSLDKATTLAADLYSLDGRFILRVLQPGILSAGDHSISLNTLSGIAPGNYILQVSSGVDRLALPLLKR